VYSPSASEFNILIVSKLLGLSLRVTIAAVVTWPKVVIFPFIKYKSISAPMVALELSVSDQFKSILSEVASVISFAGTTLSFLPHELKVIAKKKTLTKRVEIFENFVFLNFAQNYT
jgi:hypothetical protein